MNWQHIQTPDGDDFHKAEGSLFEAQVIQTDAQNWRWYLNLKNESIRSNVASLEEAKRECSAALRTRIDALIDTLNSFIT